jgi:hypothetical protein
MPSPPVVGGQRTGIDRRPQTPSITPAPETVDKRRAAHERRIHHAAAVCN